MSDLLGSRKRTLLATTVSRYCAIALGKRGGLLSSNTVLMRSYDVHRDLKLVSYKVVPKGDKPAIEVMVKGKPKVRPHVDSCFQVWWYTD
jgi:hypothetical protein